MSRGDVGAQTRVLLATARASRWEKLLALLIAIGSLVAFAVVAPSARVPLARIPGFIPSYEAALVVIDLATAMLLFDQFARLRSRSVLILASGYLFDAFIIVPHTLSFPGAFAPRGLLGAQEQTTAWLYTLWHGGFPLFVMVYAGLRRAETRGSARPVQHTAGATLAAIAVVTALVAALTLLTTFGHDLLPVLMRGDDYTLSVQKGIAPSVWVLTLGAILLLWPHRDRVVDLWLMVVMYVWLFDIALAALIGSARFDLGFYVGRVFGLMAASFLLFTLMSEAARICRSMLASAVDAERRLAEIVRSRALGERKWSKGHGRDFIERQNIARYQALLESSSLDEAQRGAIERMLAEEVEKLRSKLDSE